MMCKSKKGKWVIFAVGPLIATCTGERKMESFSACVELMSRFAATVY